MGSSRPRSAGHAPDEPPPAALPGRRGRTSRRPAPFGWPPRGAAVRRQGTAQSSKTWLYLLLPRTIESLNGDLPQGNGSDLQRVALGLFQVWRFLAPLAEQFHQAMVALHLGRDDCGELLLHGAPRKLFRRLTLPGGFFSE